MPVEVVEPDLPSRVSGFEVVLQVSVPLMTSRFFAMLSKVVQLMLPVLCMLKSPLTNLRESRWALRDIVSTKSQKISCDCQSPNLLVEFTAEINSTCDGLQLGEVDNVKLVTAGNLEATVDSLEHRHADVAELAVIVEDQVAGLGKVGSAERLELVTPEAELTLELLQRGNGNRADVTEGHVLTCAKVGEFDLKTVHVTGKVDEGSSVLQVVDVDGLQVGVLGNIEATHGLKRDTVEAAQTSVGNDNTTSFRNTLGEIQALELRQSSKFDRTNLGERGEAEGSKSGKTGQLEGVADGVQRRSREAGHVGSTIAAQSTGDLLNSIELEIARVGSGDLNITLKGAAAGVAVGIALVLDLDGVTRAALYIYC